MPKGAHPTAEDASPRELWRGSIRLLISLVVLAVLVVPFLRGLPLGQTTRTALLAWLLVAAALYWLYDGAGIRALLLLQLVIFSTAAALLSVKLGLVGVGIDRLCDLRRTARALVLVGAACAGLNQLLMMRALWSRAARRAGR